MKNEKLGHELKNKQKEDSILVDNNSNNQNFLGKKKLRILSLIEATEVKNSSNRSSSEIDKNFNNKNKKESKPFENSEDEDESDEEIEKYKNLISGKINIKNVLSNFNNTSNKNSHSCEKFSLDDLTTSKTKNDSQGLAISIDDDKNPKPKTSQSGKLLSLLPAPKKNLSDNIQFLQFCTKKKSQSFFQIGDKFKNLANPDSEIIHQEKITFENSNMSSYNHTSNNINTYSINIDDQIDKNWELKYLRNLEDKDDNQKFEEPSRTQINKNHIKSLISDHKKTKSSTVENEAVYSKYNKISTRNKYGW